MRFSNIIPEINSKCRICLCQNMESIDIYASDYKCGKISSAVMECSSVQIEPNDSLPKVICKDCLEKLRQAHEFRLLCRLSDQTLRQYVNFVINQSTAEVLVKTEPTNFIITNLEPTVTQIICDASPIIIDSSNVPIQVNQGFQTIIAQTVNNNDGIINVPVVVEQTEPLVLVEEVKNSPKEKYSCKHCCKTYKTNRQLVRHETVTHGERKFSCTMCESKFTEKSVLKSHMMAKHTGERPFKCQFCDKSYVSGSHLRIHMRSHTGEQPYTCEICQKSFTSIGVFKGHVDWHSGKRPYPCLSCPMKFTRPSHLTQHKARKHSIERTTKFQKSPTLMATQECKICGKKFHLKEQLRRHGRTHNSDKPFKCSLCVKSFIRRWDLNRHLVMHKKRQLVIVPPAVADAAIQEIYALNRKN